MRLTEYNEKKQYSHWRIPREEKRTESMYKAIMAENLGRKMDIQIHEAPKNQNRFNLNRSILRHITIKLSKVKERILKAAREKRKIAHK